MFNKILKYGTVFVVILCLSLTPLSVSASSISENDSPLYTMDYFNCKFLNPSIALYNSSGIFYSELDYDCWFSLAPGNYELGMESDTIYPSINSTGGISDKVFVFKFQILLPFSDYAQNFSFRVNSAGFDDDFDLLNNSLSYIYSSGSEDIIEGSVTELNDKLTYSISDVPGGSLLYVSVPFNYLDSSSSLFEFYFDVFSLNSSNVLSSVNDDIYDLLTLIYSNTGSSAETLANIEILLNSLNDERLYDIWELVNNIDTNIYDYLSSMSDTSYDILSYLDTFNDYFRGADWSLIDEFDGYLNVISQDTDNIFNYLYNDLSFYLSEYLSLFENYFSLQEQLITDTPSGSTSLDESLQGNSSVVPELQGTISDLDDSTESIKDGKTPEDLKEEVGDVLNPDSSTLEEATGVEPEELDPENITIVNQNVFNVVFQSFGGKWLSYLIMCLTISFAAFVLGKRF